jgi:Skp family chaperone for outer membrane proteins
VARARHEADGPMRPSKGKETRGVNKSIAVLTGGVIVGAFALQALAQNSKPVLQQTSGNAPAVTPATPSPFPVRTAVLNINKVLKNFNKAQQLNNLISGMVNQYGQQITEKRDKLVKLQTDLQKTLDPAQKDAIESQMKQLDRDMQDLDLKAKKDISSRQGTIAVEIYKDIEGVIQRVAVANGFDLVMSYPDAMTPEDLYSQPNVVRKLASQAAIPIYYKPHIDISDAVVQTLNATFPVPAPPPSGPATQQTSATIPPATNTVPKK